MKIIAYFLSERLNVLGAWLLALLWVMPLLYAIWAAIHPIEYEANFDIFAPLTTIILQMLGHKLHLQDI